MTQRQLNKLIKLKKILKAKQEEIMPEQIKAFLINDIEPKNKKALEIANLVKNSINESIVNKILPSKPSPEWIARHGTKAEPENYDVNLDDVVTYGHYKDDYKNG